MNIHYSRNAEAAETVPSVNIASHNGRKKRYNSDSNKPIYYLTHNDEFQIELYNPTQNVVRCDISLNGKQIPGGGLVLKPAERVFLDRYFNTPKKFKFETYEVGNTASDKKATKLNGLVTVKFYKEQSYIPYIQSPGTIYHNDWSYTTSPTFDNDHTITCDSASATTTSRFNANCSTNTIAGNQEAAITSAANINSLLTDSPDPVKSKNKIETGRIGEGDISRQKFINVHYDFEYSPFYIVEYKLLPYSQKPQTTYSINVARYCTDCGLKLKSNFRFCSNCGSKV